MTEYEIQKTICQYLNARGVCYTAIPNAAKRTFRVASMMKATGLQRGFPDLLVFERIGNYCGMALELKTEKGKLAPEQKRWLDVLSMKGWYASVAYGFDEAKTKIDLYLEGRL